MENKDAGRAQTTELDQFTRAFVRKCARRLAGQLGFHKQDCDDIEQSLYLKLAKRLPEADSTSAEWKSFVAVTVSRHILTMVRDREAGKRDHRRTCSINVQIACGEGSIELAATVERSHVPSRRAAALPSDEELVDLALDVADAVASLTSESDRDICRRLMHDTISQVARDLEMPRTTLHSRLRTIRTQFESRGLKKYL